MKSRPQNTDGRITEVTRRNIADAFVLHNVNWAGRFEEQQFLSRLYDLKSMPSEDPRFSNAADDIWQHRVRNEDWENHWVFYDARFNLLNASDEEYLRFLCETLHPVVQSQPEEVERIRGVINENLAKDGWELRELLQISDRPVFTASRLFGVPNHAFNAVKVVRETINADYLNRQLARIQSAVQSEPDVAIGTAKEFLETICKTLLREREIAYDSNESMPRLVKLLAADLELVPPRIAEQAKATETVKRMLSNLATVADGIAELRNLHGTGHGKELGTIGLEARHAQLVVGAASTLALFLFETHRHSQTQPMVQDELENFA